MALINVCNNYGDSSVIGVCPAKIGQITNNGKITAIGGSGQEILTFGPSGYAYPHHTFILAGQATSTVAWSTGVGCIRYGHSGIFPLADNPTKIARSTYMSGAGTATNFSS